MTRANEIASPEDAHTADASSDWITSLNDDDRSDSDDEDGFSRTLHHVCRAIGGDQTQQEIRLAAVDPRTRPTLIGTLVKIELQLDRIAHAIEHLHG